MTVGRDELWVDMTQFDTRNADRVWDGTMRDPDAPRWYRDVRSLIHRARGPAEPHELIDEPLVVETMHRVRLDGTIARLPRRPGARTLGRVLAMKAAAATTTGVIGLAAAAAATTGVVATVAATVVVPVVKEHVVPVMNTITPAVLPAEVASPPTTESERGGEPETISGVDLSGLGPVEVLAPAVEVPVDPASADPAPTAAPASPNDTPIEPDVVAEAPVEEPPPVVEEPVVEEPVVEEPVVEEAPVVEEPPADEPPGAAGGRGAAAGGRGAAAGGRGGPRATPIDRDPPGHAAD